MSRCEHAILGENEEFVEHRTLKLCFVIKYISGQQFLLSSKAPKSKIQHTLFEI